MAGNSFGEIFRITTFGESHGKAIGLVIDGCPSGLVLDLDFIQKQLNRRKPGQSSITSQRKESDEFEVLSGLFNGKTSGSPLTFIIANKDQKSSDYDHLKNVYRPSHADYTYLQKYGLHDIQGGGRSSARETAARVIAGAIAMQILQKQKIKIIGYVSQVGNIGIDNPSGKINHSNTEKTAVRCPDLKVAEKMIALINQIKKEGDTIGGIVSCIILGMPVGLGEPVFDKLHADLAKAMMSINAAHGFEYGSGFSGVAMKGSQHNDAFIKKGSKIKTLTNHSGGIQGGISNGQDIFFRVAFKPVSTLMKDQQTINDSGKTVLLMGKGRHDPCVVPRAVAIVESMAAIVILDHFLRNKTIKL